CAALARGQQACILDRVLEEEENARTRPVIALVHEDRTAPQKITVAFQREVEYRIEQRVPRTDEGGEGLARRRDQVLLEGNTLVAGQHGIARADLSVPVAHRRGDVGDL